MEPEESVSCHFITVNLELSIILSKEPGCISVFSLSQSIGWQNEGIIINFQSCVGGNEFKSYWAFIISNLKYRTPKPAHSIYVSTNTFEG